ncbi:MAG: glycosyltransferase family 2 protein [Burkholderiaceae bacterium]
MEPALSLILPFYRKLAEFRRVLPLNLPYFARAGLEIIVVMDESSEETALLQLLDEHPQVQWRVLVNDRPHDWRPPCKAINVGIRHARGRYLFVASPESAFVGDAPRLALEVAKDFPRGIAIGRVAFARFDDLQAAQGSLTACFDRHVRPQQAPLQGYYGSICGPREAFEAINGYDESFTTWGSDDDNLRVRLEMIGHTLLACPDLRLLHLSVEARVGGQNPHFAYDAQRDRLRCSPDTPLANPGGDWGRDFSRIARDTPAIAREAPDIARDPSDTLRHDAVPPLVVPSSDFEPPPGSVVPTGSRRQCRACGRYINYQAAATRCAHCTPAALHWQRPEPPAAASSAKLAGPAAAAARRRDAGPRIACVMQLRNEAFYLPGCLDHLRGHVDGVIALDDGSTDATAAILRSESGLVVDCLTNPPANDAEHAWNEADNRRRLLLRAHELGFDWVLVCDADERYEQGLLRHLRGITASFAPVDPVRLILSLRELWDSPRQYRADGIWGNKTRVRLFPIAPGMSFARTALHGQWYPEHLRKYGRDVPLRGNLYHLRMIRATDRLERRDRYRRMDPDKRYQPDGYDYLAEEGPSLQLQPLPAGREYDFDTLPSALKTLL